jgi:hypothetical protein
MWNLLPVAAAIMLALHGLIHLMGFVAYFPLASLPELPYKTAILDGRWQIGAGGMRLYSVLWLLAAIGFVIGAIGVVAGWEWASALLLAITLASLVITAFDWTPAFRGALIDIVILAVLLLGPQIAALLPQSGV